MAVDRGVETPENLRYSYLDKFQLLDGPMQLPPHKCAGCGHALVNKEDKYIDWCFDVEFYGQVAICRGCFMGAANQIGYMAPEQWESVMTERHDLYGRVDQLIEENLRLKDALASLGLIGVAAPDSDLADAGPVEESVGGSEGGDSPAESESEFDEQDASAGSSELPSDDAYLDELAAGI